jgi:hypothetical protein
MTKKYIKGKDGKFKGSIGDPNAIPKPPSNTSMPTAPENTSLKPGGNSEDILKVYEKAQLFQNNKSLHQQDASTQSVSAAQYPTIPMVAKNLETGETEELEVIESKLTNESREPASDILVSLPKDEIRFMDRDKITNALGYSVMGQGFSMFNNLVLYKPYAENSEYMIYKVDVK